MINLVNYCKSPGSYYIIAIGNKSQRKNAEVLVSKAHSTEEISEAEVSYQSRYGEEMRHIHRKVWLENFQERLGQKF